MIKKIKKIQQSFNFAPTPLQKNLYLSKIYKANIYLKREDLSPVRSYKIRGAFHFMNTFLKTHQNKLFCCASAGNHAQGFAYACNHFKVKGIIFMPAITPSQKIMKTKEFGKKYIEIRLVGDNFDQSYKAALDFSKKQKICLIPPFDHPAIIEGQSTVGLEIYEQMENKPIDMIIMPVGGGGLSSGISSLFSQISPKTSLVCTEPQGASSLKESLKAKKRIELKDIDSFVDGASVGKIGENNFKILSKHIKEPVIQINEKALCQTIITFLNQEGMVLEPAGALSIEALKNLKKEKIQGKNIVCVVSGGNLDFDRLPEIKERMYQHLDLRKYIILKLPQRAGALKEFLSCLGPRDDIIRFEYLKKSSQTFGTVFLGIETSSLKNFELIFNKSEKQGFELKDITHDPFLSNFLI